MKAKPPKQQELRTKIIKAFELINTIQQAYTNYYSYERHPSAIHEK